MVWSVSCSENDVIFIIKCLWKRRLFFIFILRFSCAQYIFSHSYASFMQNHRNSVRQKGAFGSWKMRILTRVRDDICLRAKQDVDAKKQLKKQPVKITCENVFPRIRKGKQTLRVGLPSSHSALKCAIGKRTKQKKSLTRKFWMLRGYSKWVLFSRVIKCDIRWLCCFYDCMYICMYFR